MWCGMSTKAGAFCTSDAKAWSVSRTSSNRCAAALKSRMILWKGLPRSACVTVGRRGAHVKPSERGQA